MPPAVIRGGGVGAVAPRRSRAAGTGPAPTGGAVPVHTRLAASVLGDEAAVALGAIRTALDWVEERLFAGPKPWPAPSVTVTLTGPSAGL